MQISGKHISNGIESKFAIGIGLAFLLGYWFKCLSRIYRVAKKTEQSISLGLCSDQQLSFYTLLDRSSFPYYNNTKIIKFGWEFCILWVISYGLSFSGYAINLSLILPPNSGNRKWQSIRKYSSSKKFSTRFDDLGVIIMRKSCSIQQVKKIIVD